MSLNSILCLRIHILMVFIQHNRPNPVHMHKYGSDSKLFQCSYWPPAMDRLLWLWVCIGFSDVSYRSPGDLWFWFWVYLGFSSISYWSPATDQQFWLWVCIGFSNVSYWSPQDLQFWFWVCVTDSYRWANQQGMNSNFITKSKHSTNNRIPLHKEFPLLNTKTKQKWGQRGKSTEGAHTSKWNKDEA